MGNAQYGGLYVPRNMQEAYANNTRSTDGKPGKTIGKTNARYDINVTVAPRQKCKGTETVTYFNNSTDTLKTW